MPGIFGKGVFRRTAGKAVLDLGFDSHFAIQGRVNMACSALEGIFRRQYALSEGHLAGRTFILRACRACHPGLGLQTSERACRGRELTNPALGRLPDGPTGGANRQVRSRGGYRTGLLVPDEHPVPDSARSGLAGAAGGSTGSGRRGVTCHPEGAGRVAGAEASRFSAASETTARRREMACEVRLKTIFPWRILS